MEAMAAGTVVIGRKTGGIAATITDYTQDPVKGNGFLFEEFTGAAFAEAITRAVEALEGDEGLRLELIRRTALEKNDWGDRMSQYKAFLQAAAGVLDYDYPHLVTVRDIYHQIHPLI